MQILAQGQAEGAAERGFERGDADFAVTLNAVAVAAGEQPARRPDRQVERRPGGQLLQVHVAAELARLDRAAGAIGRRGGPPPHPPKKRPPALPPPPAGRRPPPGGGGATPMTPKNGASSISIPIGKVATPRWRSMPLCQVLR